MTDTLNKNKRYIFLIHKKIGLSCSTFYQYTILKEVNLFKVNFGHVIWNTKPCVHASTIDD